LPQNKTANQQIDAGGPRFVAHDFDSLESRKKNSGIAPRDACHEQHDSEHRRKRPEIVGEKKILVDHGIKGRKKQMDE